ncbi:leucine-rich repeat-containing protein 59-like isoform X2 [Patiria miniata]|uniref:Leucine-rich repeat-containing protein 59 n=1 Tax=Patiria miniata TaxID=46514 RepID=A0A913ZVR2_PATMI|nr:leucine-rich repeat-containing protein 59-like isoform X2 [Patiria miniata]
MGKESLRDHLDGNELDLSLSNLTKVPVKELAALPKATRLDLSCNQLTSLPDNFCTLTHIVKIDLSNNSLTCLPENIGNLQNLQHLDLLDNQLEHLPISFANLRNLRWLDLKDNDNLDKDLKRVAGDCLDDKQCRECAKRVVAYMSAIQTELETQKLKKLEKEKKKAAAREKKQEALRKEKQVQKQLERQKKTEEYEAAMAAKRRKEEKKERKNAKAGQKANGVQHTPVKTKSGSSCLVVFITLCVTLVALGLGIYFFCESDKANALCVDLQWVIDTVVTTTKERTQQLRDKIASYM